MSDFVEASVTQPLYEPESAEATNLGNGDPVAESIKSENMISDHSQVMDFMPINTAVAELHEPKSEESNEESTKSTDVTPKKRGAADDESEQPSKKRSPPKGKNGVTKNSKGSAKSKKNAMIANDTEDTEPTTPGKKRGPAKAVPGNLDAMEGVEPVTPEKRAPSKGKGKKAQAGAKDTEAVGAMASGTKSTPDNIAAVTGEKTNSKGEARKRKEPVNTVATPRDIPTSWDDADPADKMLVTMKELGKDWSSIRKAWKAATGQATAGSTLPNRYNRIKVQLMHLKQGDAERLLAAKAEVEAKFQSEKYALMAAHIEQAGGDKYPTTFILKQLKELESKGKRPMAQANTDEDETEADD